MIVLGRFNIHRSLAWLFGITLLILIILSSIYIQVINEKDITNKDDRYKFDHLKRTSTGIIYLFIVAFIFLAGQQSKTIFV